MNEFTKTVLAWGIRGVVWGLLLTWGNDTDTSEPKYKINTHDTYKQWLRWKGLNPDSRYRLNPHYVETTKEHLAAFEAWLAEK